MWPIGWTQIHTSFQAGGIASEAIRARISSSSTRRPSSSRYSKPLPRRWRRMPGELGSDRRSRGTAASIPAELRRESSRCAGASGHVPTAAPRRLALRGRLLLRLGTGAVRRALGGALLRLRLLLAVAVPVPGAAAHRREARLERGHEVRYLLRLLLGLDGDLLTRGLALDELDHPLPVRVVVLRGIPLSGQRVDELAGHRDLAVARVGLGRGVELVDRLRVHDLVAVVHR